MKKLTFCFFTFAILSLINASPLMAEYLSIPCGAFMPKDHNTGWTTNGGYLATGGEQSSEFYAPVILPDSAYINTVYLQARDDSAGDAGGYVQVQLIGYSFESYDYIATLSTGVEWGEGTISIPMDVNQYVNNSIYSYGLDLKIVHGTTGTLWFYRCVIDYDITQRVLSGPEQQTE